MSHNCMLMRGQVATKEYSCDVKCGEPIRKGDLYLKDDIPNLRSEDLSKYHALCYKSKFPECFNLADVFVLYPNVEAKFREIGLIEKEPQPKGDGE